MDHPHDIYWLFNRYWWLLFPLFWMVIGIIRLSLSHSHANRTLDIIKAYADQGKEPPPELLAALKDRRVTEERHYRNPEKGWGRFFLFASLAAGFLIVAVVPNELADGHGMAFIFTAIVMMGLAVGGLVNALAGSRLPPPDRP